MHSPGSDFFDIDPGCHRRVILKMPMMLEDLKKLVSSGKPHGSRTNTNPKPSWTDQAGSVVHKFSPIPEAALAPKELPQLECLRDRVLTLLVLGPFPESEMAAEPGQKQLSGTLQTLIRSLLKKLLKAHTTLDKPQSRLQKYALIGRSGENIVVEKE